MSKIFWVDFDGYCEIEAETAEEAKQKFYDLFIEGVLFEVTGVEEKTE